MAGSSAVELQLGLSQGNIKIVSRPFLIRKDHVLAGVGNHPVICINVSNDSGSFILPNLGSELVRESSFS